jgi:transposase
MSQITLLNGPERRRRWNDDDRLRILEAAFAPGANVSDVARRFDVSTSLIYQWRALMLKKQTAPGFVPAIVVEEAPDTSAPVRDPVITVQFAQGATMLIEATAPAALVTAALRALR